MFKQDLKYYLKESAFPKTISHQHIYSIYRNDYADKLKKKAKYLLLALAIPIHFYMLSKVDTRDLENRLNNTKPKILNVVNYNNSTYNKRYNKNKKENSQYNKPTIKKNNTKKAIVEYCNQCNFNLKNSSIEGIIDKTLKHDIEENKKKLLKWPYKFFLENALSKMTPYDEFIEKASESYKIPSNLIYAVAIVESKGEPEAVSRAGAQGLLQLMPKTSQEIGINKDRYFNMAFHPEESIMKGTKYLSNLINKYNGNVMLALMAYNWGQGNVKKMLENYGMNSSNADWETLKNDPNIPKETKNYVIRVLSRKDLLDNHYN
ncbi:MAG: lytic transglycosylase domain-containing protein, partial [Candidatus Woesearchaeota archaeon]|nr:lytic transglycosylase domain-containing protein [Candidatus Woesearchaeota archaeon]